MLLGFQDYNFHRIISAVRSARYDNPQQTAVRACVHPLLVFLIDDALDSQAYGPSAVPLHRAYVTICT